MAIDAELAPFAGRLIAARPDLAAAHLRGAVDAARFATGVRRTVAAPLADLTLTPDPVAGLATQLLYGESFVVYETRADGLAWGQALLDNYVGYVAAADLGPARPSGQRVTALASHVYSQPNVKARADRELPFLAEIPVTGTTGGFVKLRGGGFMPRPHFDPITGDAAAQAERFVGVPYLWGGRSARGLDCSALVQLVLLATGWVAPRDCDMQAAMLGTDLPRDADLERGDLVFWKGHVGLMRDPGTLIHCNIHHMAVAMEPLAEAVGRIAAAGGGRIIARRRMSGPPPLRHPAEATAAKRLKSGAGAGNVAPSGGAVPGG